ncbi:MAG: hypothetical protein ACK44M_09195 [Chloroflexus sp.]
MEMATKDVLPESTYTWLIRLVLAAVIGVLAGVITYLTARAIGSAWLLLNQQALIEATRQALQQGVMGLADTNLRALRLAAEAQQNIMTEISAWFGLGVAVIVAIIAFVRLESTANDNIGRVI